MLNSIYFAYSRLPVRHLTTGVFIGGSKLGRMNRAEKHLRMHGYTETRDAGPSPHRLVLKGALDEMVTPPIIPSK